MHCTRWIRETRHDSIRRAIALCLLSTVLMPMTKTDTSPMMSPENAEIVQPRFWAGLRVWLMEISGALGDLGMFIPLLTGMVSLCGLQLGPALVGGRV